MRIGDESPKIRENNPPLRNGQRQIQEVQNDISQVHTAMIFQPCVLVRMILCQILTTE